MKNLIKRFLSFDRLLGVGLVQIIYYFGLLGICICIALGLMMGAVTLTSDLGSGAMQLIAVPAVGLVVLVLWRFLCEVFVVVFEMNERLGDLRNAVYGVPATPPDPNAPTF